MNIKIAMTVDGELFEQGDRIRVIDRDGGVHNGTFVRAYQHNIQPDWMVIRYKNAEGDKVAVVGTNAQSIIKLIGG